MNLLGGGFPHASAIDNSLELENKTLDGTVLDKVKLLL